MSFFFNDTATTEIYTLSLHDALPIFVVCVYADHGRVLGDLDPRLLGHDVGDDVALDAGAQRNPAPVGRGALVLERLLLAHRATPSGTRSSSSERISSNRPLTRS